MSKVSILIPARNEIYLQKTIDSILESARGEIEIIAVLDGYNPPIRGDNRVTLIYCKEAIGQRPAINLAARHATGKYILKTDAHSMFDEGFDVKLQEDCEYDWTVIPRMYNLDAENWKPKWHKCTDYMWIRSFSCEDKPFRHNYFRDGRSFQRPFRKEYKIYKKWSKDRPDIDDVMTGQGACFFMHRDRFWELGGMDEKHGQWGAMGVEVACKAWLSGGRQVVNKKTWFSHYFRGGDGPGFPWPASASEQDEARRYAIDLWSNNRWPMQKRPLSWLVEKFMSLGFIPTWTEQDLEKCSKMPPLPWTQEYCREKIGPMTETVVPATIKTFRNNDSRSYMHGRELPVKELYENRLAYCRDGKLDGIRWQMKCVPPFIKRVLAGEDFDDDKIKSLEYYEYLVSRLNPAVNPPSGPTPKGVKHCLNKVKDYINLINNIRTEGLKSPIDLFIEGKTVNGRDRVVIIRGSRRIAILYHLGIEKVPARIWKSEWLAQHFIPSASWPTDDDSIHAHAVRQFVKYGVKATDKYWRHNYTPWYDNHIGHWQQGLREKRILELGVKEGYSLLLWHDAFPYGLIYGLDRDPERAQITKGLDRIKIFKGDQTDGRLLRKIASEHGPFHVVVDDCSHQPKAQRKSFKELWPHLEAGGTYVIEDLQSNYRAKYRENSIVPMIKDMMDEVYETHKVREVNWYPNIVFITKA